MINNLVKRAKYVMTGEDGMELVQTIILISVALVLASVFFLFKDSIVTFVQKAINEVNLFKTN